MATLIAIEHYRNGYSLRTDILALESPLRTLAPRVIENAIFRSGKPASEGILIGFDCLRIPEQKSTW